MKVTRTATRIVDEHAAKRLALHLVLESTWFECMPLPDAEFEFTVREDRASALSDEAPWRSE